MNTSRKYFKVNLSILTKIHIKARQMIYRVKTNNAITPMQTYKTTFNKFTLPKNPVG